MPELTACLPCHRCGREVFEAFEVWDRPGAFIVWCGCPARLEAPDET